MGKTKKANYDKTKTQEIKGFTTEEDSMVIYSLDKNKRWEAYEYEEVDPHEERKKKVERKEENKKTKKEDYVLSLKSSAWNIQKTQSNPDYYGTGKAWWTGNKRVNLPEKVKRQLKVDEREEEENEEEDVVVSKGRIEKENLQSDEEEEEEEEDKVIFVNKAKKLPEKKEKDKKKKKKNKEVDVI